MTVFSLYKPFRNKIASLASADALRVIWAYSQYLQINSFQMPSDIEVDRVFSRLDYRQKWIAEWHLELLAKEVILNSSNFARPNQTLRSWRKLAEIINAMKKLEEEISCLSESESNMLLELSRVAHRQFVWQENSPNAVTSIRYYKIFNTKVINEICMDRLGISVEDVYLCGMAFMGSYLSHPAVNIPFGSDIEFFSEEKIQKFLLFTCRTISDLKSILRTEQKYDTSFVYAYNSLRAYPLVRMRFDGNDCIVCPLPTLLFWRITGGLYYECLPDARFSNAFGNSFQEYVGQAIHRACVGGDMCVLSEQLYGTKKERKASIDWIVSDRNAAIFLECKAKRLSWGAKIAFDDLAPLEADIDQLASAIVQTYKTVGDYLRAEYPHFPYEPTRKVYPVIVTLENWHLFGPVMFQKLQSSVIAKLRAASIPGNTFEDMPYSVWHIGDLEVAMQIINEVGIRPFIDGKITNPEMKQWEWHAYMKNVYRARLPTKRLFADEYHSIFSRAQLQHVHSSSLTPRRR